MNNISEIQNNRNWITCICVDKIRKSSGVVQSYVLKALDGTTCTFEHDELKRRMRNKELNILNLQLASDGRIVDKAYKKEANTLTKELYKNVQNNKNLQPVYDYKFNFSYDEDSNKLYIKSTFILLKTQHQHYVTDDGQCFKLYKLPENTLITKTKDKMLILSMLNIVDKKISLIDDLSESADCVKDSFEAYSGASSLIDCPLRGFSNEPFDNTVSQYLMQACIMEMKYSANQRHSKNQDCTYKSYLFRGNTTGYKDGTFTSITTDLYTAVEFAGDSGIVIAIKNIETYNLINMRSVAIYGDQLQDNTHEHEILLRDSKFIKIKQQVGTVGKIPIYIAEVDFPDDIDRIQSIIRSFTTVYKSQQFYLIAHILKSLSKIEYIDFYYDGIDITGKNNTEINISFDTDKNLAYINSECISGKDKMIKAFDKYIN